jgi:hypothetical protein
MFSVFSPAGAAADSAARPCSSSSVNALVSRCSGPAVRAMGCAMKRPPLGIALNDYTDEPGAAVFRHACRMGLEGIVSKRLTAPYRRLAQGQEPRQPGYGCGRGKRSGDHVRTASTISRAVARRQNPRRPAGTARRDARQGVQRRRPERGAACFSGGG